MQSLPDDDRTPVKAIQINDYLIETLFDSPFPTNNPIVHICRNCLDYFDNQQEYITHYASCQRRFGQLAYSKDVHIHKVDGKRDLFYCQCLSLLSRLFLEEKTVYFDVSLFEFYVLSRTKDDGEYEFLGYFSKEKESVENYNLSCILVLPVYQNCGYGRLLIEFSYELSKIDGLIAGPEKPLSSLGHLGYFGYWRVVLLDLLINNPDIALTLDEMQIVTGIKGEDIILTLSQMGLIVSITKDELLISKTSLSTYIHSKKVKLERKTDLSCFVKIP